MGERQQAYMGTRGIQTAFKESFQPEDSQAGVQAAQGGCAAFVLGGFYNPNGQSPGQSHWISQLILL